MSEKSEGPGCPRCGTALSTRGLCPRCLYESAKGSGPPEVVFTSVGRVPVEPPSIAELKEHLPSFEIEERIGLGGTGAVYRAVQKGLGRAIALKILHRHVASDPGFSGRFEREARTLAGLTHPNLVTVHDCGRAGPWYYIVLELVDGVDLRQMLRARELGAREALAIVAQLCDALQYAHDQGVVHRDIKPENILVDRRGVVKILDFGLAKLVGAGAVDHLTHTHQVVGTPHYMAPEQWERPLTVDHRADIFSLGVVFYELLTGELPVGRFAPPSQRVAVDVRLDEVVLRTLEREPERRYQQASKVRDDVERIRASPDTAAAAALAVPATVAPPVPARVPDRAADRRRAEGTLRWIIVAFVVVQSLAFALLFRFFLSRPFGFP